MYKEASYQEKYLELSDWMPFIIEAIKRDLKNEHLRKDLAFVKKFLQSKNINKVSTEELTDVYQRAIAEEDGEKIAEFITTRWLLKHSELYDHFEGQLNQITSDFTTINELDEKTSQQLMESSIQRFGAPSTYLFSVLNSVVFPEAIFTQLKHRAKEFKHHQIEQEEKKQEQLSFEKMHEQYEREMNRVVDKYEKKLTGLQKKYITDTEGLKKQIANLQRKLQG